ncbi:dTDP-4-dehydrorhamnose reductase [Streptomyces olivaceus]|nr:dTDP-4-dehydrorhamnose reductase [Streptomyces olivaceus]MBZ6296052.1 dTDP-4-dehydrorhamnose reductase [Streptomyces olivaceus]MBZ6330988.1 dTDP-4-dehydrorhamnose reductase [Streptomyces olivaceus]
MNPWLVTGSAGMLARDVLRQLAAAGVPAVGLERTALDVTDAGSVRALLQERRPAVVVNCAAWTAVDDAEAQPGAALAVNGTGARRVAEECAATGAVLIQVSTDYVFAGDAGQPYPEDAPTAPRSVYGLTKLAGERGVLETLPDAGYVVRTGWLYGANGPSFVRSMIRLERTRDTLDVVDDQRGQPTWTRDLADRLVALGRGALDGTAPPGVYHGTSTGETTWFEYARRIFTLLGADPERIRPTSTDVFPRPAPRPAYSVLSHGRWRTAGIESIRPWQEALAEALPEVRQAAIGDPAGGADSPSPSSA